MRRRRGLCNILTTLKEEKAQTLPRCSVWAFAFRSADCHILADDSWRYDSVPEFFDGKNVRDFVDPDIEAKLQKLEEEEQELLQQELQRSEEIQVSRSLITRSLLAFPPLRWGSRDSFFVRRRESLGRRLSLSRAVFEPFRTN